MKKFLIRSLIFMTVICGTFFISFLWNTLWPYKTRLDGRHLQVLIMGDSHVRRGINPGLLVNAESICQPAEPYVVTYWKLVETLKRCRVDTIIVGFTHHTLSEYNNYKFSDPEWSSEMFRRSYFIGNFNYLNEIEVDGWEFKKTYFRKVCAYPKFAHDTWVGEYKRSAGGDVSDPMSIIERRYCRNGDFTSISNFNLNYIDSIMALCQNQNVELILIGCPLTKGYFEHIPENFKTRYRTEVEKLRSQGITVLNLTEAFYPDSMFINPDHLNANGSDSLTAELKNQIWD